MELEARRRGRDERLDVVRVETDAPVRAVDRGARAGERVECPVAEDLDPDLRQHAQRRSLYRFDGVHREDLDRAERVGQPPPWELLQARRRAPRSPARAVVPFG